MMERRFETKFVGKLFEIALEPNLKTSVNQHNDELVTALLDFGSETEDNLNCVSHIEYGLVTNLTYGSGNLYGLKLKNKNIPIGDVANYIENLDIPPEIQEEFPELTALEWAAVTRMLTMLVSAFDRIVPDFTKAIE